MLLARCFIYNRIMFTSDTGIPNCYLPLSFLQQGIWDCGIQTSVVNGLDGWVHLLQKRIVGTFYNAPDALFKSTFGLQTFHLRHVKSVGGILVTDAQCLL